MDQSGLIGRTLGGRYKVEELLGQGGMSAVYKAYDPNLKRAVAVKTIHSHLASDPRFQSRFESEATAVAALRHSNIVQVFDFSHDGDLYFMVQEFVAGETLQERLRRLNEANRSMPVPEALRYTIDVADAAGYAHRRGMIHRDIKPANIMLDVHGQAILMDFGIVKITGSTEHTVTGAVVGTALYMPPELIRGETPDPRSDIYSLGVTLFEMISGHPPFEANSAMTLLMMQLNDPVPDLREVRPDVPVPLVDIVRKALAKDRQERYTSMAELSRDLRTLRGTLETGAPLVDLSLGTGTPVQPPASAEAPTPAALPPGREVPVSPLPSQPSLLSGKPADLLAATASVGQDPYPAGREPGPSAGSDAPAGRTGRPAPPTSSSAPRPGGRGLLWVGGALVLVALLLGAAILFLSQNGGGSNGDPAAVAGAGQTATDQPAAATDQPAPVATGEDGDAHEAAPAVVSIVNIVLDDEGRYVVDYETEGFEPDQGLVFYFDSVPPAHGGGLRYYGLSPFGGLKAEDRPENSGRLCVQLGQAGDAHEAAKASCGVLPDVVTVSAEQTLDCLQGPGEEYPVAGQLAAGEPALVRGLAPDELWWNVIIPAQPKASCWLSTTTTTYAGDISRIPIVDPAAESAARPMAAIEGIGIDEAGQYTVVFTVANFEPAYPGGTHMHFFWSTFSEADVGIGGEANRRSHGLLEPFTAFRTDERPPTARDMCVVVANPDHTVIPGSGSCYPLPDVPYVRINGIQIDDQGHYVVDFDVDHFEPAYPGGTHIHFFWDIFSEADVGIGGEANRRSHGLREPFSGFLTSDRPADARRLCAVVAVPTHEVIPRSGNCFALPDVAAGEG